MELKKYSESEESVLEDREPIMESSAIGEEIKVTGVEARFFQG